VEIEILRFVGICKNVEKDIVNIDFACRYVSGELTTSEESTEVIWATPEQALEMITFPLTKKQLIQMLSGDKNAKFFGFRREKGFEVPEDLAFPVGKDGL
jgi:8-oxo-dGTP diphosphatase